MKFDIDTVMNNPKARISILFPSSGSYDEFGNAIFTRPIYGVAETDFTTDIHGLYSSIDPGGTAAAQQTANAITAFTGGANRVIKSVLQTLQRFDGHTSPVFTIPIIVIKYKPEIDLLEIVRTLQSAPAGTVDGASYKGPYNYGFSSVLDTALNAGGDVLSTFTAGLF